MRFRYSLTNVLLAVTFSSGIVAQQIPVPDGGLVKCSPTHLRFTARTPDGMPVPNLASSDFTAWFGNAPASVISLNGGVAVKSSVPDTDILFVVPPFFRLNDYSVRRLIAIIRQADNFHIVAAVLAPDGKTSAFSSDANNLRDALSQAILPHVRHSAKSKWASYEEEAFVKLRGLPGRHVIVDLQDPANPFRSPLKASFIADRTMERLALFDGSQVYDLIDPVQSGAAIPMGDASTIHSDIGPGNHGIEQLQQMQEASKEQAEVWNQKDKSGTTGGRRDVTVEALIGDILQDAPGSYDSVIQPTTSCIVGRIYSVNVTSRVPGVRLFGPNAIQEIPSAKQ